MTKTIKSPAETLILDKIMTLQEEIHDLEKAMEILGLKGGGAGRPARKDSHQLSALKSFVEQNQPIRRKNIMECSSIPAGTIGFLLKERNGFRTDANGLWCVTDRDDAAEVDNPAASDNGAGKPREVKSE